MSTHAIVYVVQDDGQKNLLPALKFGALEPLIVGRDSQLYNTGPLVEQLRHKLAAFREQDYLLTVGDPVAIGIATAIAADHTGGKVQMLKWDRQEKQYYVINIDIRRKPSTI